MDKEKLLQRAAVFILLFLIFIIGCTKKETQQSTNQKKDTTKTTKPQSGVTKATAILDPTSGSNVKGVVTFTKTDKGIKIVAFIEGLTPGKHGFHIHEKGDCSAPDGSSAGGHFNPMNMEHAGHDSEKRHEGDMGNITADESGKAHLELIDTIMTFDGPNSIIGRSVIVHEKEDDLKTQPTGNAGGRVACGVIDATD